MADIDKGLPNTRKQVELPSEEQMDVSVEEEITEKGPVEVTPEEDGGATIDFEPGAINIPGTESHFDNLADILPDDILEPIGNEMVQNYMDYKSSRKDWERGYTEGLDLLGFKNENRTEPFQGASRATHPVHAEADTQYQAQANTGTSLLRQVPSAAKFVREERDVQPLDALAGDEHRTRHAPERHDARDHAPPNRQRAPTDAPPPPSCRTA